MNKLIAIYYFAALGATAVHAQEPVIYQPKYLKGERAEHVVNFIQHALNGVAVHYDTVLNLISINNGLGMERDNVERAAALLKKFDVPDPSAAAEREAELTIHLIRAFTDPKRVPPQDSIPPDLTDVIKEMKASLPYSGYKFVGAIPATVRDGLVLQDALPAEAAPNNLPHFYSVEFSGPSFSSDGKTFSLKRFHFGVRVPNGITGGATYQDVGIFTSLTIRVGQKLGLGKISIQPSGAEPLFLILTLKVR